MINKVMGNVIPNVVHRAATGVGNKGSRLDKALQNKTMGKVFELAADNQNVCQAAFALAICCAMRPATNYVVTKDKKDATFASAHSISSGVMGFVWPMIFATPLAVGVKKVLAKPQKYLKPEMIKKFYPNAKMTEKVGKDGKTVKEIATNAKGEILKEDGSVLLKDLTPLRIQEEDSAVMAAKKAAIEKEHPNVYVDSEGTVRSKEFFEKEKGEFRKDENGNKIGVAVQKDFTPITEEIEQGAQKEKNVQTVINMCSDIILAPIRASLTIAMIPTILGFLGLKKAPKGGEQAKAAAKPAAAQPQKPQVAAAGTTTATATTATATPTPVPPPKGGNTASGLDASKKGGAR